MSAIVKPKILIAGASGFIGSSLHESLAEEGEEVHFLIRDKKQYSPYSFHWDPVRGAIDERAFENVRCVVNLCGENIASGRWTAEKKSRLRKSRIAPTRLLATTIASLGRRDITLLNASAVGFYGNRGDELLSEQSPGGDGFLSHLVRDWEQAAEAAKRAGARVAHLRFGVVLGPGGGLVERMRRPFSLGLGAQLGPGTQFMSWVALTDAVRAIRYAMTYPVEGPVNIVSPTPVTNAEFTRAFAETLHRPRFLSIPTFAARLVFGRDMADEMLLTGTRAVPVVLLDRGFHFECTDIRDALRRALKE